MFNILCLWQLPDKSFVKFEKVDKSYDGEVLVVKNLNLDIAKGEFLTMLDLQVQEKQHA